MSYFAQIIFLKAVKIYTAFGRSKSGSSVEKKSVDCRVETRCRAEGRKLKERKERKERRKTEYLGENETGEGGEVRDRKEES